MLWLSLAFADLLVPAPEGKVYVTHSVRIEGVPEGKVLLVFDGPPGGEVEAMRVYTTTQTQHVVARGSQNRGGSLGEPGVWMMALEDYTPWNTARSEDVAKQEAACMNGEGCAHISRFVPTWTMPEALISCNHTLELQTQAAAGEPEERLDVFAATVTDDACSLQAVEATPEEVPGTEPSKTDPPAEQGAVTEERVECGPGVGPISALMGGLLLLLARRP